MSSRGGRIAVSLCLVSALLLAPLEARSDGFDRVVRVLKGVAWAALSVGVEEAGSRLLGPTVWGVVKRLGEPVVKELITAPDQKPTREAVTRTVYLLESDPAVRETMRSRFDALNQEQRDALADKLTEIENHLVRIERLVSDQGQSIEEIKTLLLSVLRTPTLAPVRAWPDTLRRFDALGSPLEIFYPKGLTPPRHDGSGWIAGSRVEQGLGARVFDAGEPWITFQVLGVPRKTSGGGPQWTLERTRQFLVQQDCDSSREQFLAQEFSSQGFLIVAKCDRRWPIPNTYVAARLFWSNGASVLVRAAVVGDDSWKELETPLLDSMRWTRLRAACGFYATACCLPAGDNACESGLTCLRGQCLPPVPKRSR